MILGNYYYYCKDLEKAILAYQELLARFPGSSDAVSYKSFLDNLKKEQEIEKK